MLAEKRPRNSHDTKRHSKTKKIWFSLHFWLVSILLIVILICVSTFVYQNFIRDNSRPDRTIASLLNYFENGDPDKAIHLISAKDGFVGKFQSDTEANGITDRIKDPKIINTEINGNTATVTASWRQNNKITKTDFHLELGGERGNDWQLIENPFIQVPANISINGKTSTKDVYIIPGKYSFAIDQGWRGATWKEVVGISQTLNINRTLPANDSFPKELLSQINAYLNGSITCTYEQSVYVPTNELALAECSKLTGSRNGKLLQIIRPLTIKSWNPTTYIATVGGEIRVLEYDEVLPAHPANTNPSNPEQEGFTCKTDTSIGMADLQYDGHGGWIEDKSGYKYCVKYKWVDINLDTYKSIPDGESTTFMPEISGDKITGVKAVVAPPQIENVLKLQDEDTH